MHIHLYLGYIVKAIKLLSLPCHLFIFWTHWVNDFERETLLQWFLVVYFIAHRNYLRCRSSVPMPSALPLSLPQPLPLPEVRQLLRPIDGATVLRFIPSITARYTRVHTHRYSSIYSCLFISIYVCFVVAFVFAIRLFGSFRDRRRRLWSSSHD